METARCLVILAFEFSSRVKHRQHDFERAFTCLGMLVHWDPATVVRNGHGVSVLVQRHYDFGGVAVHGFVHRVVEDFPNQMMEA